MVNLWMSQLGGEKTFNMIKPSDAMSEYEDVHH